ncbi:DUF2252 domain-containing protein [Bifidobacterium subtile]|jgi:uncharacterized protein (DUF2252 family)|uniref:DUF2252 domain-containing protein n=2 Tax=Bifidobacterium subtile TaxID=77635 RepID=UPI002F354797
MYRQIAVPPVGLHSVEEQEELGRQARKSLPRSAARDCSVDGRDPVDLITAQDESRLASLVPLRHARMGVSPFRFYRGTAGLMAYDLAGQADTGVNVIICGDAHIGNFGFYASPERNLMFDLNDFDESAPGPWEWDVKRMAASAAMASLAHNNDRKDAERVAAKAVGAYRRAMKRFAEMPMIDRYYLSVRDDMLIDSLNGRSRQELTRVTEKARRRTSEQAVQKLMVTGPDGWRRFREEPPVLQHLRSADQYAVNELTTQYLSSVRPDIALLVANTRPVDIALRVVGVGSVGTRCYVVALEGPDGLPLVLQIKEAQESVITRAQTLRASKAQPLDAAGESGDLAALSATMSAKSVLSDAYSQGRRVVACQQVLQSVSDNFLGWLSFEDRDYYVRQFRDMKGSVDVDTIGGSMLARYARTCAILLARAHAQSPACYWIAGYLGKSDVFDRAVGAWSLDYADQMSKDYEAYKQAIADGRVEASEVAQE